MSLAPARLQREARYEGITRLAHCAQLTNRRHVGNRAAVAVGAAHPPARARPSKCSFWFFRGENTELIVKVLNACSVNNHYWVFACGLTNVQVEVTVTDRDTGTSQIYNNLQSTPFLPIQDTAAFATCP